MDKPIVMGTSVYTQDLLVGTVGIVGTFLGWAGVTKFAYLKDLLVTKVRAEIDGLPFSSEGYERAKNILKSKYGETSEVVNAYVQNNGVADNKRFKRPEDPSVLWEFIVQCASVYCSMRKR